MERTAEIKEYARLILEELKDNYKCETEFLKDKYKHNWNELSTKLGFLLVRELCRLETDNPDLENFRVTLQIVCEREILPLRYKLKIESNTILNNHSSCDWFSFICCGIPPCGWVGEVVCDTFLSNDVCSHEDIIDEIAKHIILASENAESLIFDKYNERFISRTCANSMRKYTKDCLRRSIFANKKSFKDSICTVCHDPTTTKTPCRHHLCMVCWEKLQKKTCPCCRCNIECRVVVSEEEEEE